MTMQQNLAIFQIDIFSLPMLACMAPDATFYSTFKVYTCTVCAMLGFVLLVHVLGSKAAMRKGLSQTRLRRFKTICLQRAINVMMLTLIVVCKTVVALYKCDDLGEAGFWLGRDRRIKCYTWRHNSYRAVGILAILAYPVGIPFFIWSLMKHFKVDRVAAERLDNAWLVECLKVAANEGIIESGDGDVTSFTVQNIPQGLLQRMHHHFLRDHKARTAAGDATGRSIRRERVI